MTSRINFVELAAPELTASRRFYSDAFGFSFNDFGPTYACTLSGDIDLGLQADGAQSTAAPLVVIAVDNLEAVLEAVERAGGIIIKPIFTFPGGQRFHFRDPGGNELAAWQAD